MANEKDQAIAPSFVLVWGRRLDVRPTIEEALEDAWYMSESDEGWFDQLEVVYPDGTTQKMDRNHPTVADEFSRRESEQAKRWAQSAAARPYRGNITVDGAVLESIYGDDDVDAKMAPFRVLGDRLKFKPVHTPSTLYH